ncbi:hypothetical protein [Tenacibaculum finnmarkense]|uniref:hypothetical protein n=1 Tax=Tenacibaculum finnmarkense TaxID=2781243 RepID=UPI001EFC0AFA|nr:hypothetical protein [Tenacibaculum finnmarkense]MCG8226399.1 hypothetical protein [Tenacibaculum finnmarkense genomovar finnmarkense]
MVGINIFFYEFVENFKHLFSDEILTKSDFIDLVKKDTLNKIENINLFLKWVKSSDFIEIYKKDNLIYWKY